MQEQRKNNEQLNNENSIANQRGQLVLYGDSIQLKHEASGQWLQLSKSSAEKDKTCLRLELSDAPVASRVCFQITPRYKYRQDGDCIVFRDQILLYNQKNNAYVHFSGDASSGGGPVTYPKIPENGFQSPYRQKSPLRRRNPENYFPWFEANVGQNFEKWTILAYRHCNSPSEEARLLHGGDIVRIKHAESGGYLTVDENS